LGTALTLEMKVQPIFPSANKQRLALVRLILAKPDWAFLDEATSALDLETEKLVMSLLQAELPDTTFVSVAHREPQGLGSVRNVPLGIGLYWCRWTSLLRARQLAGNACDLGMRPANHFGPPMARSA
jgi:hypothetical protein